MIFKTVYVLVLFLIKYFHRWFIIKLWYLGWFIFHNKIVTSTFWVYVLASDWTYYSCYSTLAYDFMINYLTHPYWKKRKKVIFGESVETYFDNPPRWAWLSLEKRTAVGFQVLVQDSSNGHQMLPRLRGFKAGYNRTTIPASHPFSVSNCCDENWLYTWQLQGSLSRRTAGGEVVRLWRYTDINAVPLNDSVSHLPWSVSIRVSNPCGLMLDSEQCIPKPWNMLKSTHQLSLAVCLLGGRFHCDQYDQYDMDIDSEAYKHAIDAVNLLNSKAV